MKIQNSKGQVVQVPKKHERIIRNHIKKGNHKAVSDMVNTYSPTQNQQPDPQGMQSGPQDQPNGMQFNFGGTIGSILSTVSPALAAIPGWGKFASPAALMIGDQLQKDNQPKMAQGGGIKFPKFNGSSIPVNPLHEHYMNGNHQHFGKFDDGGQLPQQNGQVDINVEGYNKQQGPAVNMQKGELLVKDGRILKNYIARPPHPEQGLNPDGDVSEQEGSIVIPKNRTKEYMNSDKNGRKMIEKSLVSQQDWRANKAMNTLKKGGLVNPKMYVSGGAVKCDSCDDETLNYETGGMYAFGGNISNHSNEFINGPFGGSGQYNTFGKGGWIQDAHLKKGRCSNPGDSNCPKGSRQYALAMRFKHGDLHKHQDGGNISYPANMGYANGGLADSGDMMFKYSHPAFMYGGEISEKTHPMSGSAFAQGGNVSNTQLQSMHGPVPFHPQQYPSRGGTINPGTGQRQMMHYPYNKTGPAHYFRNGGRIKMDTGGVNNNLDNQYNWNSNIPTNNPYNPGESSNEYQNPTMDPMQTRTNPNNFEPVNSTPEYSSQGTQISDLRRAQPGLGYGNGQVKKQGSGFNINPNDIMTYTAPAYNIGQGLFGKPKQLNSNDYRANIGAPRYVDPRTGQRELQSAYASGKQNVRGSLPGMIELNSQYQGNESDRTMKLGNVNANIYNNWLGQKLGADQFNAESRFKTDDFNTRSQTAKSNLLASGLGDLSKIGQNNENNNTYQQWLNSVYPNMIKKRKGGRVTKQLTY